MANVSLNPSGFRPFIINIRCGASSLNSKSVLWIMNHFDSRFGKVSYFKFPKDPDTEWYRGFGFIHFAEKSAGLACLAAGSIHEVSVPSYPAHSLKHGQLRLSDLMSPRSTINLEVIKCVVEQGKQSIHNGIEQRPTIDQNHAQFHQSINHEEFQQHLQEFGGFFGGLRHKRYNKS